ncbi:MAG: hypothetical protein LH660_21325 [Phormidesmis sp. CAN_BIN36]|nr:hypothetical protein [Phormidesmis sp. CAN_BIN36]
MHEFGNAPRSAILGDLGGTSRLKRGEIESLHREFGVAECHYDFPHPRPFSLRRREPEILFPRPLGEGEGEGEFRLHS